MELKSANFEESIALRYFVDNTDLKASGERKINVEKIDWREESVLCVEKGKRKKGNGMTIW